MRLNKKFAAIALTATVALTATAAFAYWSTTGGGSGSAGTGTSTAVTVTQVGTISGLVPGGTAQAVDFKINNSLTTNQHVSSVAVSIDETTVTPAHTGTIWNANCSAADFTIVPATAINADLTPGDHTYSPSGATLKLDNRPAVDQSGCKNQTLVLAFSAS